LNVAAPAVGSSATEKTIMRANMVRAKAMSEWREYPATAVRGQVTISRGTH
jgi:hypothetical protein